MRKDYCHCGAKGQGSGVYKDGIAIITCMVCGKIKHKSRRKKMKKFSGVELGWVKYNAFGGVYVDVDRIRVEVKEWAKLIIKHLKEKSPNVNAIWLLNYLFDLEEK